jgi:hypothetical protein
MQLHSNAFDTLLSGAMFIKALEAISAKHDIEGDVPIILLLIIELHRKCDKWPTTELVRLNTTCSKEEFTQLVDDLRAAGLIAMMESRVQVIDKGVSLLNSIHNRLRKEMDYRANHLLVSEETRAFL